MRLTTLTGLVLIGLNGLLAVAVGDAQAPSQPKRTSEKEAAATAPQSEKLEVIDNSIGMKLIKIPAGSFQMGSDKGFDDEAPVHRVTLSQPFYLAVTEVTQQQYEAVMGDNPSQHLGPPELPVDTVSWEKAVSFCEKLSERENLKYRLPTEAEWEYACRAGSEGPFGLGAGGVEVTDETIEAYAWFRLNSDESHPVGQKKPNAWGLYDMHGNVFEWCQDNWLKYSDKPVTDPVGTATSLQRAKGDFFVLRGGSWEWGVDNGKAAARCRCKKVLRSRTVGFRVARTP